MPALPLDGWRPTYDTLHLWSQMVGKTRLALAPMENHWWQLALWVTSRGMGGAPLPVRDRTLDIDFDFIDHRLVLPTSEGETRTHPGAQVPRRSSSTSTGRPCATSAWTRASGPSRRRWRPSSSSPTTP